MKGHMEANLRSHAVIKKQMMAIEYMLMLDADKTNRPSNFPALFLWILRRSRHVFVICAFGNETRLDTVTRNLRDKIHSLIVGKSMIMERRAMYPSLLSSTTISGISHNKVNHESVTTRVSEVQEPKCPTKQQLLSAAPSTSQPSRLEAHNR